MEIDSYELKSRLTVDNTIEILEYYGAEIKSENEEYIVFSAICHNSSKGKLYLYKETNSLYCWSQCGGIDVIHIVQQEEDLDFLMWELEELNKQNPKGNSQSWDL